MAKKRPNWLKWMLVLLIVLPLGLLAGLLIGRAVDPGMLFQGERVSSGSDVTRRADTAVDRRDRELLEEEPPASLRPEFENEEEAWSDDYAGRRDGDAGEYEYYSGEELFSDEALFGDDYRSDRGPEPRAEAEIRAQDSAPATTSPDPSSRYARLGERDTAPVPAESRQPAQSRPSEPRTADGDLPAIW